jgi:PDZ domain-containing secreted protein
VLRSRSFRLFLLLFAVVAVTSLVLTFVPSDHYLVLPDQARPTDPLVSVPGEETGSAGDGGIYMVDVRIGRANLFERQSAPRSCSCSRMPPRTASSRSVT